MDLPYDDDVLVLQILSSIECDHVESFRRVPTELKNDETFVLRAVARNYHVLQYVDESLRKNREFMIKCVKLDHNSLIYACEEILRNDKEFILICIRLNSESLCYASGDLKNDKEVVLEVMKHSNNKPVNSFRYASTTLQSDKEFVNQCATIDTRVLLHASEELLKDENFVIECFMMDDSLRNSVDFLWRIANVHTSKFKHVLILKCIDLAGASFLERVPTELRNDSKFMMRAVKQNRECIQFASESLQKDEQFQNEINKMQDETSVSSLTETEKIELERNQAIEDARTYGVYFLILNDKWKNNDRVVLQAVKNEGRILYDLSGSELTENHDFIPECIKYNVNYLQFVSEQLRNDEEFMLQCVKRNKDALKWIGEQLNDNKQFMSGCMKEHKGMTLEHAPHKWRDDEDVVLAAVKKCGLGDPLQFASERLRNDKAFVMQCVKVTNWSLKYASEQLRHDREFVLSVVIVEGSVLVTVPHFKNDTEIVMSAVLQNGTTLSFASDELKNDKEIVMSAVMQHGGALQYASDELRNDEHVVMSAVKKTNFSFLWVSESLRNNVDFILECIGEVGARLLGAEYLGESAVPMKWKDDFEFMVRAVKLNRECLEYASDRLKCVPEFDKVTNLPFIQ